MKFVREKTNINNGCNSFLVPYKFTRQNTKFQTCPRKQISTINLSHEILVFLVISVLDKTHPKVFF